jgi:hypothetical protein
MAKGKNSTVQHDGLSFSIVAFIMSVLSAICLKVILYETFTKADTSVNPLVALVSVIYELFRLDTIFQVVALAAVVVSAVCLSFAIQRGSHKNSTQAALCFFAEAYDILFLLVVITGVVSSSLKF